MACVCFIKIRYACTCFLVADAAVEAVVPGWLQLPVFAASCYRPACMFLQTTQLVEWNKNAVVAGAATRAPQDGQVDAGA